MVVRKWQLTVVALALVASMAGCDHRQRVTYKEGILGSRTAYTSGVLNFKTYNEVYAGGTAPLGIYYLTSGGTKIWAVNGEGYVYKTTSREYARAYCWNRSSNYNYYGRCDYIYE